MELQSTFTPGLPTTIPTFDVMDGTTCLRELSCQKYWSSAFPSSCHTLRIPLHGAWRNDVDVSDPSFRLIPPTIQPSRAALLRKAHSIHTNNTITNATRRQNGRPKGHARPAPLTHNRPQQDPHARCNATRQSPTVREPTQVLPPSSLHSSHAFTNSSQYIRHSSN